MIVALVVFLTLIFALGSVCPLLVTDDMQDVLLMEQY